MAEGDVTVSFSADASDLIAEAKRAQAALVGIGEGGEQAGRKTAAGMTEAERAVTRATVTTTRAAREQAAAVASSMRQSRAGVGQLGQQLADVGIQLQMGTSPMTILIQQGPQVASALDLMGISLTRILTIVGPIALAVGGLVLAWQHYSDELAVAEARQTAAADAATSLGEALAKSNRIVATAADAEAIALGTATEAQHKQRDAVLGLIAATDGEIKSRQASVAALQEQIKASREAERAANERGSIKAAQAEAEARKSLKVQLDNEQNALRNLTLGRDRDINATVNSIQAVELAEQAARAKADADRAAAKATDEHRRAALALFAALQADAAFEIERRDAITAAILGAQDAARASEVATLTGSEKIQAALEDEIALLREKQALILQTTHHTEEEAAIKAAFTDAEVAATARAQAEMDALREAAAKKEEERQKKQARDSLRLATDVMGGVADGLNAFSEMAGATYEKQRDVILSLERDLLASEEYLTDEQIKAKQKQIEEARKMARRQFELAKSTSLAGAIVNTAEAVTQALASGPPPGNLILAGISGAAGAVQVAAIANQQPSFHTGRDPDEFQATLQRGEAVLSRQGVAAANDGISRGGGERPIVVEMRYGHRVFDRFVQRDLQRTGTLANAMRQAARGRT